MIKFIGDFDIIINLTRLSLALLCGGILGMERGRKNRPAGFRTYMLVCLGAALVMMTNEFINGQYGSGDVARMGAQVINGIGFLGAGTIICTGHNKVKGLTTAAGLWASACIGLAIGIGYYIGAILGTIMIYIAMALLHKVDERVMSSTKVINLYIELEKSNDMKLLIKSLKENNIRASDLEIKPVGTFNELGPALLMTLHLSKRQKHLELIDILSLIDGVLYIEEV